MSNLPAGTLTFLFTDIEGSTRLWEADPDWMRTALAHHDQAIETGVHSHGGTVFKHTGDGICAVFVTPEQAIAGAVAAQRGLAKGELRVRMGVHTGQAEPVAGDYFGPPLNRCARVMAAAHGGQIVCSATTAAIANGVRLRDLGSHRLRDLAEPQQLFQVVHEDLLDNFPPLRALDVRRHNLPVPRTSFVGRERELAELREVLESSRLVTVTGAGGSGKTRLSAHVAADLVGQFHDGVFLVELAAITDPTLLVHGVAEAIGVPLSAGQPGDVLPRYVENKRLLLLFDNCEHLLDACAELIDSLLAASNGLKVLATSREPLGLAGERVLRIPSLGVPSDESSVDAVVASEAGRLFADRAAMVRADFVITRSNVEAVALICRRLDGIPLALELAAARLRHLSVRQVADRLDDRFRILTGGGRTVLPRQQTLQATLDWSYDLLSDDERTLFRRLSVFVGSFPLDAVEGVCAGDGLDALDVMDVVGHLVDRSLVVLDAEDEEPLYRLLETMRHFAQQKLIDADEGVRLRDRHRDHYAARLDLDAMTHWLHGIVPLPSHVEDNLRPAIAWAVASGADDAAHRLVLQLAQNCIARGLLDDGAEWVDRVVARPFSPDVVEARGWVLVAAGTYASLRSNFRQALGLVEQAEAFIAEHSLRRLEPQVFAALGIALAVNRSIADGEAFMERAATSASEQGFMPMAGAAWVQLAGLRLSHDPPGACVAAENAVAACVGREPVLVAAWATLAVARLVAGDSAGAAAAVDVMDGMTGSEIEGWGSLETILTRAPALAAQGRAADARREMGPALEIVRELRIPLGETAFLVGYASVDAFGGDPRLAIVLLGAARRRFGTERAWRAPIVGPLYVHSRARARSLLTDDDAKDAWDEGMALSGDEAFALVPLSP